jgi:hypothetical protein
MSVNHGKASTGRASKVPPEDAISVRLQEWVT